MAKRLRPPSPPSPNRPGVEFWLIAALAIVLLIGGVVAIVWFNRPSPPPIAEAPLPAYVPPPPEPKPQPAPPPVIAPALPATLPQPATEPSPPQVIPTPPVVIPPPTPIPAPPPPTPLPVPKPPATVPASPRPPPVILPPSAPVPPRARPIPPVVQRPARPPLSAQMSLGNPSNANGGSGNFNNYLLQKPYFALSYNDSHGEPNWVSWRVIASDLGTAERKTVFDPETALPSGFRRVVTKDYVRCGFDRGHLCPHSDRAANLETSYATFVMSNIIPQAPELNQKSWARLEDFTRDCAKAGNTLLVVAGPAGKGGVGKDGAVDAIAGGRVVVPAFCWKIVVVVPPGPGSDISRITSGTRVIAILAPNKQGQGEDWTQFLCTVADIEKMTGYTFFDTLPANVAAALRVKRDAGGPP